MTLLADTPTDTMSAPAIHDVQLADFLAQVAVQPLNEPAFHVPPGEAAYSVFYRDRFCYSSTAFSPSHAAHMAHRCHVLGAWMSALRNGAPPPRPENLAQHHINVYDLDRLGLDVHAALQFPLFHAGGPVSHTVFQIDPLDSTQLSALLTPALGTLHCRLPNGFSQELELRPMTPERVMGAIQDTFASIGVSFAPRIPQATPRWTDQQVSTFFPQRGPLFGGTASALGLDGRPYLLQRDHQGNHVVGRPDVETGDVAVYLTPEGLCLDREERHACARTFREAVLTALHALEEAIAGEQVLNYADIVAHHDFANFHTLMTEPFLPPAARGLLERFLQDIPSYASAAGLDQSAALHRHFLYQTAGALEQLRWNPADLHNFLSPAEASQLCRSNWDKKPIHAQRYPHLYTISAADQPFTYVVQEVRDDGLPARFLTRDRQLTCPTLYDHRELEAESRYRHGR